MGEIQSKVAQIERTYSDNSQQTSVATHHLPSPATFPQYQGLPPELKLTGMVWEHAFERRHINIWGQCIPNYASRSNDAPTSRYVIKLSECNPVALSLDRETRAMALSSVEATAVAVSTPSTLLWAKVAGHELVQIALES